MRRTVIASAWLIAVWAAPAAAELPPVQVVGEVYRISPYPGGPIPDPLGFGPLISTGTVHFTLYDVFDAPEVAVVLDQFDPNTQIKFSLGPYSWLLSEATMNYGFDVVDCCFPGLHNYPNNFTVYLQAIWAPTSERPGLAIVDDGAFFAPEVSDRNYYGAGNYIELSHFRNLAAIPEPSSWALMLAGFGAVGAALRHRRRPQPA